MKVKIPLLGKVIAVFLLMSTPVLILGAAYVETVSSELAEAEGLESEIRPYSAKKLLDYAYLFGISLCGAGILMDVKAALPSAAIMLLALPVVEEVGLLQFGVNAALAVLLLLCFERVVVRQIEENARRRRKFGLRARTGDISRS